MHPSQFLAALRARLPLFLITVGAIIAGATVLSLLLPKSYRATTSLVVDTREEQSLSEGLNVFVSPLDRAAYIRTQVDVIMSPKVARKVIDDLALAARPAMQEDFAETADGQGSIEDWLVEELLRDVDVETSPSSVIRVRFDAENPEDAALIANGFAQAYIDTTLELRVGPTRQAAAWFDEQLKTLRADLEAAYAKMTDYQQRHGIVSVSEGLDEEYSRLTSLSDQLIEAQRRSVELGSQQALSRRNADLGSPLDHLPEVQASTHIQELNAKLLEEEAELEMLGSQYGPSHPTYRRQVAEVRSIRDQIDAGMQRVLATTENARLESEQQTETIETALTAQRERLLNLKESRDELTVLMRNVDTAQSAYDTALQRFVVSQVESRASQANVALLSAAVAPRKAHRPNLLLNVTAAVIIGTMLGLALVLVREISDRRVRLPAELVAEVNVPVLGELEAWTPEHKLQLTGPIDDGTSYSQRRVTGTK